MLKRSVPAGIKRQVFVLMIAFFVGTAASSGQFDQRVTALTEASFKHLRVAYGCRHVLGDARYHEAHIAVENALRATGLPTHVAMASAGKLAKEARAFAQSTATNSPSLCFTTFVTTKKAINRWRKTMTAPPSDQRE